MRQVVGGTATAAVDQSTPDSAARSVVGALNRRDIDQFVGRLVCEDGRNTTDDGSTTLAEETLYRDVAPFDPNSEPDVASATPAFTLDEVRQIKPSDVGYSEEMAEAQVAIVSVAYPDIPEELRADVPNLRGVLTFVNENSVWVVCEMGFVPAAEVPGEVAPDPDPTSPTGRAQAFVAAVNAGDVGTARIHMCANAGAVDEFVAGAVGESAQLRLNKRVEPSGESAQLQVWYTVGGQESRAGGIMQQEPDGWCVLALGLLAG
jgi:hypothetical protein